MKKFILYIFLSLLPKIVSAQALVATQTLDMGTIAYVNQGAEGRIRVAAATGSYVSGVGDSIQKANPQVGIVHFIPPSNGNWQAVNNLTTTLMCVNCSSPSCSDGISFTSLVSPSSLKNEGNFNFGGTIVIPGDCLAGVYHGVLEVRVKKGGEYLTCDLPVRATLVDELKSIIATSEQNLSFGTILVDGAYTVTVGTDGTRTSTKPAAVIAGGTIQQGIFSLNNTTSGAMNVNGVTLDSNITLSNGTSNIAATLTSSPAVASITNVAKGKTYINVGGTLTMTGNETAGTYLGSYTLMVNY